MNEKLDSYIYGEIVRLVRVRLALDGGVTASSALRCWVAEDTLDISYADEEIDEIIQSHVAFIAMLEKGFSGVDASKVLTKKPTLPRPVRDKIIKGQDEERIKRMYELSLAVYEVHCLMKGRMLKQASLGQVTKETYKSDPFHSFMSKGEITKIADALGHTLPFLMGDVQHVAKQDEGEVLPDCSGGEFEALPDDYDIDELARRKNSKKRNAYFTKWVDERIKETGESQRKAIQSVYIERKIKRAFRLSLEGFRQAFYRLKRET